MTAALSLSGFSATADETPSWKLEQERQERFNECLEEGNAWGDPSKVKTTHDLARVLLSIDTHKTTARYVHCDMLHNGESADTAMMMMIVPVMIEQAKISAQGVLDTKPDEPLTEEDRKDLGLM